MSQIYISTPDGGQVAHPEDQIRSMWRQGLLSDSTMYWMEGMPEWLPLRDYFGPSASTLTRPMSPPPLPQRAPEPRLSFTKDPSTLTTFVKTMLWISIVVGVISILSDSVQLNLLRAGTIAKDVAEANDVRQQMIGFGALATFIVTGIAFLKWIYRANVNSRGFGATGMTFTPGWSIGYYFIPVLNLFRPYQAMKEIWQVSKNPRDWANQPGCALLTWWWTLWILSSVFGQLTFQLLMHADNPSLLTASTVVSIISGIVDICSCLVAISLVTAIYRSQKALVGEVHKK